MPLNANVSHKVIAVFTTLDAQPQEWMEGDENVFHTVAACSFKNIEHAEYWINRLIPKNKNGEFIKWSGGRRKEISRKVFIENCHKHVSEFDFQVNCVSSMEGEMSWFAWAFYMQNRGLITQQSDSKNRNCLIFQLNDKNIIKLPVLRAGYLIWYHNVVRYLVGVKGAEKHFLSDNFCNDAEGPGEGKAKGVAFVNYLLSQSKLDAQISLATNHRFRQLDRLSDFFCGWVNSVRSGVAVKNHENALIALEQQSTFIDNITFATNLKITNETGEDVTESIKDAVVNGSIKG